MYHAACKVEFQPFNRWYSQLTFFNFFVRFICKKKGGKKRDSLLRAPSVGKHNSTRVDEGRKS